jgi:hypothetical protein
MKTDDELMKWFRDRLVWNEPDTVIDLLKSGLFVRIYAPQVRKGQVHGTLSCQPPGIASRYPGKWVWLAC